MASWSMIVTSAAATCLIAGTALAQHQMRPPNQPDKPAPPNTPITAPSHWGPPLAEPPKDPARDPKPAKPLKPPKPIKEPKRKDRGPSARHNDEADPETRSTLPTDQVEVVVRPR
jgi:hypothetical protein